jgi:hypothetical protein
MPLPAAPNSLSFSQIRNWLNLYAGGYSSTNVSLSNMSTTAYNNNHDVGYNPGNLDGATPHKTSELRGWYAKVVTPVSNTYGPYTVSYNGSNTFTLDSPLVGVFNFGSTDQGRVRINGISVSPTGSNVWPDGSYGVYANIPTLNLVGTITASGGNIVSSSVSIDSFWLTANQNIFYLGSYCTFFVDALPSGASQPSFSVSSTTTYYEGAPTIYGITGSYSPSFAWIGTGSVYVEDGTGGSTTLNFTKGSSSSSTISQYTVSSSTTTYY